MTPEMKKLVEEIEGKLDLLAYFGETQKCEEAAIWCITRIAQAIEDGLSLPNEAGWAVWAKQGDEDHIYEWAADVIENGARTFIAFCQEEEENRTRSQNREGGE